MAKTKLTEGAPPFPNREDYPFVCTVRWKGLVIDVENKPGSVRTGTDANDNPWKTAFEDCYYGEIRGSLGVDGDPVDVYIPAEPDDNTLVYVVHQNHPRTHPSKAGQYDEDKVVLGAVDLDDAKQIYLKHYSRKDFFRSLTVLQLERFKRMIFSGNGGEKIAAQD